MINPIVYNFIKQAVASNEEILEAASKYYDNDDPEDPKRRWDHVLDDIEVAKKIRGRDLTPVEFATLAFHDSGYKNPKGYMWGLKNHPKLSRKIFKKEAPGLGFNDDEIKHMAKVISYHMRTPKKGSPLLKDDLQMLMFGADEGTPKKPVDDARKYFMKAVAGRYPEVPDKSDPQFIKKLVERVRTFKDYSNAPGLEYYHKVYPNYHRDLYNYWHSDQIEKDYEQMLADEMAGKSLKQKSEKKKTVKKASKLYTYVDPEADLSKGLLSVKLAPEDILLRRYSAIVKDLKNKNKDAIIKHFEDPGYGPRRTDLIFALDAPIPDNANEGLLRFRDKNKLVSWDPEQVKDLISVVRRRNNPKRLEEVPANFEPLKHVQWWREPKDTNKRFLYAPSYKVLTESGKIQPELLTMEDQDKYTIHGAILGCLGDHAKDFKYNITEDLPDDPWKAIINTGPVDSVTLRKFHKYHKEDVDKAGVPYYFLTKNDRTGDKAVWYSDEFGPTPINTKKQIEKAKQIGLDKGLKEEQLDFKFN